MTKLHDYIEQDIKSKKQAAQVFCAMPQRTVSVKEANRAVSNEHEGAKPKSVTFQIMPAEFENACERKFEGLRDVFKTKGKAKCYIAGKGAGVTYVMDLIPFEDALEVALPMQVEIMDTITKVVHKNWPAFEAKCVEKLGSLQAKDKKGKRYFKYNSPEEYLRDFVVDIRPAPLPIDDMINPDLSEAAQEWVASQNNKARIEMYTVPLVNMITELDLAISKIEDPTRTRYTKDTFNALEQATEFCFESCTGIDAIKELASGWNVINKAGKEVTINFKPELDKCIADRDRLKDARNKKRMISMSKMVLKRLREVLDGTSA